MQNFRNGISFKICRNGIIQRIYRNGFDFLNPVTEYEELYQPGNPGCHRYKQNPYKQTDSKAFGKSYSLREQFNVIYFRNGIYLLKIRNGIDSIFDVGFLA